MDRAESNSLQSPAQLPSTHLTTPHPPNPHSSSGKVLTASSPTHPCTCSVRSTSNIPLHGDSRHPEVTQAAGRAPRLSPTLDIPPWPSHSLGPLAATQEPASHLWCDEALVRMGPQGSGQGLLNQAVVSHL